MTHEPDLQLILTGTLNQVFSADPRIRALWLKGSLGRQTDADRHSDIDLHVWIRPEDQKGLLQDLAEKLEQVRPLLHLHPLFDGAMVVTLLQAVPNRVMALDLFLDTDDQIELDETQHRVLFDRDDQILLLPHLPPQQSDLQRELEVQIRLFWRTFAMLPTIERGERIQGMKRLTDQVETALQICSLGRGRFRDIGENRGNVLLLPEERQALEDILAVQDLRESTLVEKHLQIAAFVQQHGRRAAAQLDTTYPHTLEQAVMSSVHAELQRMDLSVTIPMAREQKPR